MCLAFAWSVCVKPNSPTSSAIVRPMLPEGFSPTLCVTFASCCCALAGDSAVSSMFRFCLAESTPEEENVPSCCLKAAPCLARETPVATTCAAQQMAPAIMPVRAAAFCCSAWLRMLVWIAWFCWARISRAASRCFWPTSTSRAMSL